MSIENTNIEFSNPYETFLLQHGDHIHQVLQDIQACKIEAIRRTSVNDIDKVIKLFKGATLQKRKEALIEFLKVMPEYRTTDQELLYRRLKALKEHIKVTHGTSDLYYWAMRRYNVSASESDA